MMAFVFLFVKLSLAGIFFISFMYDLSMLCVFGVNNVAVVIVVSYVRSLVVDAVIFNNNNHHI